MPTTVLIVDDHPSFRSVARMLLETEGYEVVGEAPDGEAALELAERAAPRRRPAGPRASRASTASRSPRSAGARAPRSCWSPAATRATSGPLDGPVKGFIAKAELSGDALREVLAT